MIYFTIPVISGIITEETDVYVDRNPVADSKLNLHKQIIGPSSQVAPNGINIRDERVSFRVVNMPAALAISLNKYLVYLGTGNLSVTYPEGVKNYYVTGWSIIIKNLLYADVSIDAELMYL